MSRTTILFALIFTSIAHSIALTAQTTRVVPSTQYPTIQSAIDASSKNDTVLVNPGTYRENLLIEANTITGNNSQDGGGIVVFGMNGNTKPDIYDNTITYNTAIDTVSGASGGGLFIDDAAPRLVNNVIARNTSNYGGGIMVSGPYQAELINNTIVYNAALK